MTLGMKLCLKGFHKKLHTDIMNFQLQQIYSYEVVGKSVCITRMVTRQK